MPSGKQLERTDEDARARARLEQARTKYASADLVGDSKGMILWAGVARRQMRRLADVHRAERHSIFQRIIRARPRERRSACRAIRRRHRSAARRGGRGDPDDGDHHDHLLRGPA
ncbi:MAG: hypothetical protein AABM42_03100 [Actinomycetota bacterium]